MKLTKGSEVAKKHMARLRAMRGKRGGGLDKVKGVYDYSDTIADHREQLDFSDPQQWVIRRLEVLEDEIRKRKREMDMLSGEVDDDFMERYFALGGKTRALRVESDDILKNQGAVVAGRMRAISKRAGARAVKAVAGSDVADLVSEYL